MSTSLALRGPVGGTASLHRGRAGRPALARCTSRARAGRQSVTTASAPLRIVGVGAGVQLVQAVLPLPASAQLLPFPLTGKWCDGIVRVVARPEMLTDGRVAQATTSRTWYS
jgi:hypothetical protein